jgi:hypothetical protein
MKVAEKDYVIAYHPEKKEQVFLGKVRTLRKDTVVIALEEDRHIEPHNLEVSHADVTVNFGPKPTAGKAFGYDLANLYRKTLQHSLWGDVHFFVKASKEMLEALDKALDSTGEKLDKMGLLPVLDRVVVEIKAPNGTHAGMYKHSAKKDGHSRIIYCPREDYVLGGNDGPRYGPGGMRYVLYHEVGHAVRYQFLNRPSVVSAWLKLFNRSIQMRTLSKERLGAMWDQVSSLDPEMAMKASPKVIVGDDEEAIHELKIVFKYLREIHHISPREAMTMIAAGKLDVLEDVWPRRSLATNDLTPTVSEYACKNVEELFAEAFAFYILKVKLPKDVTALMERSLEKAKDQAKKAHLGD